MPVIEAAMNMLALLDTFSEKQSNAVLEVLKGKVPRQNEKFPQGELHFQGSGWRGFYHCHDAPGKDGQEHGHFHLFVQTSKSQGNKQTWSHLAGLSMDYEGQPIKWFTVNRWVTDGIWLPAEELKYFLDSVSPHQCHSLCEQWLLCMVSLYTDNLKQLLEERDRQLIQINADTTLADSLLDRDIYMLSCQPVDLEQILRSIFNETEYRKENTL